MTDMLPQGEPKVRRWTGQRWALDNVLRSVGIDWDQPRSFYLNAACGIEGGADFAAIRERVKKYADIEPAFANTARRREAKARAAEEDGSPVTARDNYFMAAIHWGSAQWSHYDNDATNLAYNKSKRDCYTNYARAGRSQDRAGDDSVQGQDAAGLVPSAAELQRRPHSGGDLVSRHGHLQGGVRGAQGRPLARARHRRAGARRARPGRMPRARA